MPIETLRSPTFCETLPSKLSPAPFFPSSLTHIPVRHNDRQNGTVHVDREKDRETDKQAEKRTGVRTLSERLFYLIQREGHAEGS